MTPATGTRRAAQADFAAALLDPQRACPQGLRAWNGSDPARRLAVYRNNVVISLIDALAETFPVVQQLVGDEFFSAMAGVFVRGAPPQTRILAFYGEAFAGFIEQFEPAASVPYLVDVARLEMARVHAYHAADAEPVSDEAVALALAHADRADELRLTLHPSVSVLTSPYAIVSLWAAHQGAGDLAAVDPGSPEQAMVLRQGLDVLVLRLAPGAAEFLTALRQGLPLAEAAGTALAADAVFDLAAAFALCLGHGAIASIQLPRRQPS
jgi:hypothetical protein